MWCFTLVSCLAYSSILKMETIFSSETSVHFQRTTRRYVPEDRTLHNHRCENLKFQNNEENCGYTDGGGPKAVRICSLEAVGGSERQTDGRILP
jgi:hypothetical protein